MRNYGVAVVVLIPTLLVLANMIAALIDPCRWARSRWSMSGFVTESYLSTRGRRLSMRLAAIIGVCIAAMMLKNIAESLLR